MLAKEKNEKKEKKEELKLSDPGADGFANASGDAGTDPISGIGTRDFINQCSAPSHVVRTSLNEEELKDKVPVQYFDIGDAFFADAFTQTPVDMFNTIDNLDLVGVSGAIDNRADPGSDVFAIAIADADAFADAFADSCSDLGAGASADASADASTDPSSDFGTDAAASANADASFDPSTGFGIDAVAYASAVACADPGADPGFDPLAIAGADANTDFSAEEFYEQFRTCMKLCIHKDSFIRTNVVGPLRFHAPKSVGAQIRFKEYLAFVKKGQSDSLYTIGEKQLEEFGGTRNDVALNYADDPVDEYAVQHRNADPLHYAGDPGDEYAAQHRNAAALNYADGPADEYAVQHRNAVPLHISLSDRRMVDPVDECTAQ